MIIGAWTVNERSWKTKDWYSYQAIWNIVNERCGNWRVKTLRNSLDVGRVKAHSNLFRQRLIY